MNKTDFTPDDRRERQRVYFKMLAEIGVTKHLGSLKATDEMLELCHVGEGSHLLDVGCGIGLTPPYLVKEYGCRVVGIDLVPRMIARSLEQARRDGITEETAFCAADAQALPFADGLFDVVMIESVNVFVPDLPRAFGEYLRVIRPGGYVGMNESTWLESPSEEAVAYMEKIGAHLRTREAWEAQLSAAGLEDVVARDYALDLRQEAKGRLRRFGCNGMLRALVGIFPAIFKNAESRALLKEAMGQMPNSVTRIMGYGVYVGRKPSP